ncbi:MAG: ABC transporter ATP-binding protein [Coriobacteriia bacterium]
MRLTGRPSETITYKVTLVRMDADEKMSLFELREAKVMREGRLVLDIERLVVRAGEHVAVLGPNGSGKSTLIQVLTRDLRPLHADEPPARLLGRSRWDLFEARRVFGVVSEDLQVAYARRVSVWEVVASGFFGSVGLYRRDLMDAGMERAVEDALRELEIEHLAEREMASLSTGEARRALIARALVHDPMLLVLDEPCAGLDPRAAHHVRQSMSSLARSGRSMMLVTHHVEDIVPEVERVIMLSGGRIVADGAKHELLTSERLSGFFGIPCRVEERDGWYRMW